MIEMLHKLMNKSRLFIATVFGLVLLTGYSHAADWASILMYHRFGEQDYPSTNIRMEQFREHLEELKKDKYTVLPLGEIVDKLKSGAVLPDRSVAITIDDAYLSVYENAWPLLKEAGFPFTIFVSTDNLDQKMPAFMNWAQLKEMADQGVYVGHHTASHAHLPRLSADKLKEEIERASESFKKKSGICSGTVCLPLRGIWI